MKCRHMKNNKYLRLLIAVSVILSVLTVGMTIAYMFRVTDEINNEFKRATVNCEVIESFDKDTGVKSSITVKNTGNINAYLRVRLVSYWKNSEGDIIAKQATIPSFTIADDWTNDGDNVYRYNNQVAPNDSTPNLFAEGQTITLGETDAAGNYQVIEVFAEAIQTNAVDEW